MSVCLPGGVCGAGGAVTVSHSPPCLSCSLSSPLLLHITCHNVLTVHLFVYLLV